MILVRELQYGQQIIFDGDIATVRGIYTKDKDGTAILRFIRAQQSLTIKDKYEKIKAICQKEEGTFIYCSYKHNMNALYEYLIRQLPSRQIFRVSGDTPNFQRVINTMPKDAILIATKVTQQSIDLYQTGIVFECPLSNVGSLVQTIGRLTRYDSESRDVNVYLLYRDRGIDNYLIERCALLVREDRFNKHVQGIPRTPWLKNFPDDQITFDLLKQQLLWVY